MYPTTTAQRSTLDKVIDAAGTAILTLPIWLVSLTLPASQRGTRGSAA